MRMANDILRDDSESMDIFLFSNGQQYSPPRKYHLRADELNWWDSTLGFLARCQYGSVNPSIELYTLRGEKLLNPNDLRDGTAYVAVVPPDTFIDTGYEKYMVKATRSREKRIAKNSATLKPEVNKGCLGIGIMPGCSKTSALSKTGCQVAQEGEKRKLMSGQRNSFLRKNINAAANANKKLSEKKEIRIATMKINSRGPNTSENYKFNKINGISPKNLVNPKNKIPKEANDIIKLANELSQANKLELSNEIDKLEIITLPSNQESKSVLDETTIVAPIITENLGEVALVHKNRTDTKTMGNPSEQVSSLTAHEKNIIKHKSQETETPQLDNIINDKDLIEINKILRNSLNENELHFQNSNTKLAAVDEKSKPFTPEVQALYEGTTFRNFFLDPQNVGNYVFDNSLYTSTNSYSNNDFYKKSNDINLAQISPLPGSSVKGTSASAKIKTDGISLKLNLSIKDGRQCECSKSATNAEKDVQHEVTDVNTSSNSVGSSSGNPQHTCCRRKGTAIVPNCPCCGRTDARNMSALKSSDAKTILVIVPIVTNTVRESSTSKPHNKTESSTADSPKTEPNKVEPDVIEMGVQKTISQHSKITVADEPIIVSVALPKDQEKPNNSNKLYMIARIDDTIPNVSEAQFSETDTPPTFAFAPCLEKNEDFGTDSKQTQTKWCNVLFELKREEDGHYTFHLPPLHVIKLL